MTQTSSEIVETATARLYGASELGVLSFTSPGDAHPRVEYVGGELFVGLVDANGVAITQGVVASWPEPFPDVVASVIATVPALPAADAGMIVVDDETLSAALLVDPRRLADGEFAGAPVVFALARDCVVIVGADDDAAIARVLTLADELFEAGGPLVSGHPIVLTEGAWAPFPWRERLPELELRFERMLRLFSVRAYEAQSAVLQRPDVHIADAKIRVLDSGVMTTFATWPKGTATLLPVVDNVIIADPAGTLSVATFAQFLDAGGDAIVRTGLSPLRYFVPGDRP